MTITAETGRAYVPFLRRHLRAAHATLESTIQPSRRRLPLRQMSLALVGDARMSELHHQFMGLHGPTDVLTFPIDDDEKGNVASGEVIVCVPEARRQAKQRTIPVRLELLLYSIHGMLHLLGYDDRTARDFHNMHATEDDVLTLLGFGPVFAPARAPAPRAAPHSAPLHDPGLNMKRRSQSRAPQRRPRRNTGGAR